MERISYAANSVLTGDALAHAIVRYARALAMTNSSDTVAFPVLLESGDVATAEILIGPASQLLSVPEPSAHDDLTDEDLVSDLGRKTAALGVPRPETEEPFASEGDDDYAF